MGVWSALTGTSNATSKGANADRRAKLVKQASAAKAAGRGSRQIRGAVPAKKTRGW